MVFASFSMINTLTTITFYSLYLVKEELANSYVIDADNYLFKNMFRNDLTRSTYFSVYREDCTNEWFLVYGDATRFKTLLLIAKLVVS